MDKYFNSDQQMKTSGLRLLLASILVLGLLMLSVSAQSDDALNERLSSKLRKLLPGAEITSITETPIKGLYEVMVGASITYMSADGKYAFSGDLIDIDDLKNLTDDRRRLARADTFADFGKQDYIEFRPNGKVKRSLYVFTDIDCGYCRKLHQEVGELNAAGVAVRYLAFPRAGIDSESFDKLVSVWCAKDRNIAMTSAKSGTELATAVCDNPVAEQFEVGADFGIRGTPAVYLDDGRQIGGFRTAKDVIKEYVDAKS